MAMPLSHFHFSMKALAKGIIKISFPSEPYPLRSEKFVYAYDMCSINVSVECEKIHESGARDVSQLVEGLPSMHDVWAQSLNYINLPRAIHPALRKWEAAGSESSTHRIQNHPEIHESLSQTRSKVNKCMKVQSNGFGVFSTPGHLHFYDVSNVSLCYIPSWC